MPDRGKGERLRSDTLRERLIERIAALRPGDRLPSERALAKQSGLSLLAVNKVVSNLAAEGRVERIRGVGTFVARRTAKGGRRGAPRLRLIRFVVRDPGKALRDRQGYTASFFRGIRLRALQEGFEVLPTAFEVEEGVERLPKDLFEAEGIEGAIFVEEGVPDYTPLWHFLEQGRRLVAFDYASPERGLSSVCFDNAGAVRMTVRRLAELGHRRFAYLASAQYGGQPLDERTAGFRQGLAEAGLGTDAPVLLGDDESLEPRLLAALAAAERPTAFVLFNDWQFLPLARACAARGLDIPRDVSAVGFGNAFAHEPAIRQPVDSVAFDEELMGAAAFELCALGARGVVRSFPGRLVLRGTSGPFGAR